MSREGRAFRTAVAALALFSGGCATTARGPQADACFHSQNRVFDSIERYRDREGRLPRQLADLVPQDLPDLPVAARGRPVDYRQDGRQFSLLCEFAEGKGRTVCEMTEDRRWNCRAR